MEQNREPSRLPSARGHGAMLASALVVMRLDRHWSGRVDERRVTYSDDGCKAKRHGHEGGNRNT